MEPTPAVNGTKCYPLGIVRAMEALVEELANLKVHGSVSAEYIQDKARSLRVLLNG